MVAFSLFFLGLLAFAVSINKFFQYNFLKAYLLFVTEDR